MGHSHTTPLPSGSSLNHCYPPIPKPLPDISVIFFISMIAWFAYHPPLWVEINGGMVPEMNEIDGAMEVNEDKHLIHGIGSEHLRNML